MSDNLAAAEAALQQKVAGKRFDGSVKFDIEDEGVLRVADGQVTRQDGEADVTVLGDLDTFREIFEGDLSPTAAYMTGRIRIEGDLGQAMKLSALLG